MEHEDGNVDLVGNRTEGALLILLRNWGCKYKTVREQRHDDIANMYGFSSAKKMASVMLRVNGGLRLYNKVCESMLQQLYNILASQQLALAPEFWSLQELMIIPGSIRRHIRRQWSLHILLSQDEITVTRVNYASHARNMC